jgi:hypothetical protein
LRDIPLEDNSVDVVLTIHALEPNGGEENVILNELRRVSRKYVILVEPDYLNCGLEQQIRMESLNYIGDLRKVFPKSGLELIECIPLKNFINPYNKASLFILSKDSNGFKVKNEGSNSWVDPIYKSKGVAYESGFRFGSGIWYPMLNEIPFLRVRDGKYTHNPG